MSKETNSNESKKFFSENPFQKRIIFEKVNKQGPIEQKLVIHHKKNVRKSLLYKSKEDFDKENNQKEKSQNSINNKNRKVIKVGNKELIFDNLFIKKGEYPEGIGSQNSNNDIGVNSQNSNPFNNNINPFTIKNEDDNEKKNIKTSSQIFNPFIINNNHEKKISNNTPILKDQDKINKSNPFLNLLKNIKNNEKDDKTIINPFSDNRNIIANPFVNKESNTFGKNPFLNINNNNESNLTNPFINITDKGNKNPFITSNSSNPFNFISNNIKDDSSLKEKSEDEEDNKNIEEELKIEKDEGKLKNLKEVQYSKEKKFYEIEIQNLQYLEHEQGKNKYVSKGSGIFSFQEEKDQKGKKIGIFALRESSTKSIKLQGIIINSTTVEKAKTKNGIEFIFIKNILVKYSKYEPDKMTEETKVTFLRIRIDKDDIDNFYNKTNEFFNLIKK